MASTQFDNLKYAIVDVETTGLSVVDSIIEIAIFHPGQGLVLQALVNPKRPISNSKIHGITDADVATAPTIQELRAEIVKALVGRVVVGHNVSFDLRFIVPLIEEEGWLKKVPSLCTMDLAKALLGNNFSLANLARHLDVDVKRPSHRAASDVVTTTRVLGKLRQILAESDATLEELGWMGERVSRQMRSSWKRRAGASPAMLKNGQERAEELTNAAVNDWEELGKVLQHTFDVDDAVDWQSLKSTKPFSREAPKVPQGSTWPQEPIVPRAPKLDDFEFLDAPGAGTRILDIFSNKRKEERLANLKASFEQAYKEWAEHRDAAMKQYEKALAGAQKDHQNVLAQYDAALAEWEQNKRLFEVKQARRNQVVDQIEESFRLGEPSGVKTAFDIVLANSKYPDWMPGKWKVEVDSKCNITVDLWLPTPEQMPTVKGVRYIKSRDEFKTTHHSQATRNKAYNKLVYQVGLRTIHELLEADLNSIVKTIAFNARVDFIDPATGKDTSVCIASAFADAGDFRELRLANVQAKDAFMALNGRASARLQNLKAVEPWIAHSN